jgi:hypothetical protein
VIAFTEFVTAEKLEKNEENSKDREMSMLKVTKASINGGEEAHQTN